MNCNYQYICPHLSKLFVTAKCGLVFTYDIMGLQSAVPMLNGVGRQGKGSLFQS